MVLPVLKIRLQAAWKELENLLEDRRGFPLNYNHYYTDTVHRKRQERIQRQIETHVNRTNNDEIGFGKRPHDLLKEFISSWSQSATPDMEEFSCEEALDCLLAIYKVGRLP